MCQKARIAEVFGPLFNEASMRASRKIAISKFDFFTHVTSFFCIDSIRNSELRSSKPTSDGLCPEFPTELVGNKILCLAPYPRDKTVTPSKPYPHIKLGILPNDLPDCVMPDWSYSDVLNDMLTKYNGGVSIEEAFMAVARNLGSIGCWSGIKADKLRVCVAGDAWGSSPETWPLLSEVPSENIFKYEPSDGDKPGWLSDILSSY